MTLTCIDVIIVNYNTLGLLRQCLDHLLAIGVEGEQITIIDNASSDGSREWLQISGADQFQVVLSPHNSGFASGCNLGIRKTTRKYVLLLNTDAFPNQGALETLVEYLEQHTEVGIVGPQLLYPDGRWQRSAGRIPSPRTALLDALGITSVGHIVTAFLSPLTKRWLHPRAVEYVDGACMLIKRVTIEDIGLFDERFFFFVEDAEFCYRARKNGWLTYYIPQSRVVHLRGGSSSQKNHQASTAMQLNSRKLFVEQVYGKEGWKEVAFWSAINYWWRYRVYQILARNTAKREKYQFLNQTYWKAYLAAKER